MADAHLALAWLAVLAAVAALVAAVALATGLLGSHVPLDRLILAQIGTSAGAAVLGLALPVTGAGPADPLHVLYAVVAVLAMPAARYLGRTGSRARRGSYAAIGGIVVLGVLLRLFMTGR